MLCVSIVYTLSTKRYARWLTLTAAAISAASMVIMCGPTVVGGKPGALLLSVPSVVLFVLACKRGPSTQLGRVLDTYVVSSLPVALLAGTAARHYGAFLFTAAFVRALLDASVRARQMDARGVVHTERKPTLFGEPVKLPHMRLYSTTISVECEGRTSTV